jgi:hypothetical protein
VSRKPLPPVPVPGDTPWERLDSAVRAVFSVPKAALLKAEAKQARARAKKKRAKSTKRP